MKTITFKSFVPFLFCAVAQLSLINDAAAQQADNPVYVNLRFQASLHWTSQSEPGELWVQIQDETGAWVSTSLISWFPEETVYSATQTARLYPNKTYTVSAGTSYGTGDITFEPVAELSGASVYIGGDRSYRYPLSDDQNQVFTVRVGLTDDYPLTGDSTNLRGGEGSSIVSDKPIWYLGLGRMRNGESAGGIGFRKQDFGAANFFTPAVLHTGPSSTEVDVVNPSGVLRQVFSREVLVDIQTVSSTSYKLDVYPRSQVGVKSGGLWTFSGSPFATYTVSKITLGGGGSGVKIERLEDGVTWETSLELVSTTWTHRDWRVQGATADSKITTNYTTGTAATVSHSGPPASGAGVETPLVWSKTFTQHSWGKELNAKTYGPPGTVQLETSHSYYTTTGSGALNQHLKWIKESDGSWRKFDYYDTDTSAGSTGMTKRIYRQWLDTSATPDTATTSNSAYEDWTYTAAGDGVIRFPSSRVERAPGGTILSKTEWTYNHDIAQRNGCGVAQSIRYDYWGSGGTDRLATTTQYHRYVSPPYADLREKPVSVEYPDGRKDSYAYFNGSWNESNKTFTATADGDARLMRCYHGQTTGGTTLSSVTLNNITWQMTSVQMVAGKSTWTERVVDIHGRVVFEAENAWQPDGSVARIAGVIHRFDTHGREYETVDIARSVTSAELKTVRTYSSGLLLTETAPEGKVTKFEYDSLLRMFRKTDGFGGPTGFPAKITELKFDGANRVAESYSCSGCGSGATFYEYDGAGRLSEKSEAAPGGGELLTLYSYPSITRLDTLLPSGATREEQNFLDGRPKSITGTAQPPATFEYAVDSSGLKVTRKNGTTTDNGWLEEKRDLLGRVTARSQPSWQWNTGANVNNVLETQFNYNTAGQLWRERTYYPATSSYVSADRIFVYDAGGRLFRRGLDVNNSGTLTTNSTDRIVDVDETISPDIWGWQLVTTVNTYATAGASTATEVSQTNTRLTGFNQGSLSGGKFVIGDVVSFDSSDRYSLRWDYANPGSKSIESDFLWQGFPGGYQKGNNGYVSEVLGKNGERQAYEYDSRGRLSHVRGRWTGSAYAEDTAYTYHGDTQFVASVTHGGIATSYAYAWATSEGPRKVTVTEAAGKTTHTAYNAMDLPWQVWGSAAQPVEFGYDTVGRRTSMTTWRTGSFTGTTWPGSPAPAPRLHGCPSQRRVCSKRRSGPTTLPEHLASGPTNTHRSATFPNAPGPAA